MAIKQNYFHRRKGVASISASVKSGMGVFAAEVSHMEEAEADRILGWYEPSRDNQKQVESITENEI